MIQKEVFWIVLLFLSLFFSTITTLPFPLIVLLCYSVVYKKPFVFVLAFLSGLYLDLTLVGSLGKSSIFFIVFIFLLFLYDRKFEIQTTPFVFLSSFLGILSYLLIFGYDHVLLQAVASSLIAVLLFKGLLIFGERKIESGKQKLVIENGN